MAEPGIGRSAVARPSGVEDGARPRRALATALFAALLLLGLAWSSSTPPWASPDENAQGLKAWSVAHGQVLVPPDPRGGGVISVPRGLAESAASIDCLRGRPGQVGSCVRPIGVEDDRVEVLNPLARYNPVYYLVVGWPTVFLPQTWALGAMRVASAVLMAAFATSAVLALARRGVRWPTAAIGLLGLTPMTVFLGSVVNPSGLEIMAAAALWANGLVLATAAQEVGPAAAARLVRRAGVAASAMVLTRGLSPLWLGAVLVVCLVASVPEARRAVPRGPAVRWAGVTLLATVAAVGWIFLSAGLALGTAPNAVGGTLAERFALVLRYQASTWPQLVGNFGWLDTPLPRAVTFAWFVVAALVVAVALVVGRARQRVALVLALLAAFVLPLLIETSEVDVTGVIWQGRYSLPLVVGVPMLAAVVLHSPRGPGVVRVAVPVLSLVSAAAVTGTNAVGFVWALHRYVDGLTTNGGFRSLTLDGPWQPVLGARSTAAVVAVLLAVVVGLVALATRRPADMSRRADAPVPGGQETAVAPG